MISYQFCDENYQISTGNVSFDSLQLLVSNENLRPVIEQEVFRGTVRLIQSLMIVALYFALRSKCPGLALSARALRNDTYSSAPCRDSLFGPAYTPSTQAPHVPNVIAYRLRSKSSTSIL